MSLLFEEIPLSPKLEVCGENKVDIRNQRPRLRRNSLFLGRKAGGGVVKKYHLNYTHGAKFGTPGEPPPLFST